MEKIKSVISGHRKSTDAPHEEHGSPATQQHGKGAAGEIPHPIYDQFTGKGSASGEPTKTTDNAPHFSNTANVRQAEPSSSLGTSTLRPDASHSHSGVQGEEMSTASIKSGVIGYAQGAHQKHDASGNDRPTQQGLRGDVAVGGDSTSVNLGSSRPGVDGPIDDGVGRFAAPPSSRVVDEDSYGATHTPGLNDSTANSGTDRSFPLAGGVTHSQPTEKATISEREPGTKEKHVGVHDGQGKEALAGAAAAATPSSGFPNAGERDFVGMQHGQGHHPDALAAATAAAASTRSPPAFSQNQTQEGERHIAFRGSPEAHSDQYTSSVPVANASEKREPRLHVPGEFPSPTPISQSNAPSYFQSKDTPAASSEEQHELRHTGTLDHPQMRSTTDSSTIDNDKPEHHYGQDAAIAGGLGAAGAGAYAAGKHGHDEPTQTSGEIFPTEASPYSSTKIDPRVDNRPAPYDQQKFDPTISKNHRGRDAVLTGGAPISTSTRTQPTQPTSQTTSQPKDEKSQHHYGRDATLVGAGAGAATTAGLYPSQRSNEPDSGPAKSTIGPHKTDIANVLDPRVQPDPALQKHHYAAPPVDDPAPSTVGQHKSDMANIIDPRVQPDPQKQKAQPKDEHHYGRDAALVGGTGAAGYGAHEVAKDYDSHRATQPATSMNEQRYDPFAPGAHNPSLGTTQRTEDQNQKPQQHYGRDAAIVGGLGAAGARTYAATRGNDSTQQQYPLTQTSQQPLDQQQHSTQPTHQLQVAQQHNASSQATQQAPAHQQHYPTQATQQPQESQHHYGRDAAVVGGLGAAGAGAYAATRENDRTQHPNVAHQQYAPTQATQQTGAAQQYPTSDFAQQLQSSPATQQPQHHDDRDAGVAGGLGAAGAGAYAATRGDNHRQQPGVSQQQYPMQAKSQQPLSQQQHQRYDSAQDPNNQHQKRDAAALGAAGAAAGAGGAWGYSQHDAEKERKAAEKAREQQLKDQQKDFDKKQKEQEKAFHDKQKELDHQHSKEQKHHNKLVAAEGKKHQKEMEKEQREQQKEAEKAHPQTEEESEKKKHHLFGFLHRDKDKSRTSDDSNRRQSGDSSRHSKEYAGAVAGAGVAGGAAAYEGLQESDQDRKERNKLHKEPPPGHPARETMENQQHQAHVIHPHSPTSGKRERYGTDGRIGDPNRISGSGPGEDHRIRSGVYTVDDSAQHHTVTEPHTGLPMNAEKYGSGAGGTDGNPNLQGYHESSPEARQGRGQGEGVTDWDNIKKKNTFY
ncbi:hypothetical protein K458DRAFT_389659 [Lentithecium fluviatile CBS 122367]|uniref:Uncharacterized protein n=1 Tax=Lentithecium fluviatile CBS 122367 TaxID=1168545 RepID=A0A6G1IZQ4_9PLEO|nr:hypothetical protein K458DRAFT_389659 [Lentithecium fluviatile CBS 122367]